MWWVSQQHNESSHRSCVKYGSKLVCIRRNLYRFTSLISFRSNWRCLGGSGNRGRVEWSRDEETQEIKECHYNSLLGPFSQRWISPDWLWKPWAQSRNIGAGFQRWYKSIQMKIFLVSFPGSSSILLFCFRSLLCRPCYHFNQRDGPSACHNLSFHLWGGEGADSWSEIDKWVLLRFIHVSPVFHPCSVFCCSQNMFFLNFVGCLLFTELENVLSRLKQVKQGPSNVVCRALQNSKTSGHEKDVSERKRRFQSKRTQKMRKMWGQALSAAFSWLGP